jgi:hypothetical protein
VREVPDYYVIIAIASIFLGLVVAAWFRYAEFESRHGETASVGQFLLIILAAISAIIIIYAIFINCWSFIRSLFGKDGE